MAAIWICNALSGGSFITACCGYTFELVSITAYSVIVAILSVLTVIFVDKPIDNKILGVLLTIITPISLINAVLCIYNSG